MSKFLTFPLTVVAVTLGRCFSTRGDDSNTIADTNSIALSGHITTTNNAGTTGILFRELRSDAQDGSWGPNSIDIPGFDHVALSYVDSVYESHPGYENGPVYVSADPLENRTIPVIDGVQNVHSIETFKHNSPIATISPVINVKTIPIDIATAMALKNIITPKLHAAGFLPFNSVEEFVATHDPPSQKGGNGRFTGVGLVEWAAEQAGINNGQGFVPNAIESITTPNESFPLLSPELMYTALQNQDLFFSTPHFLKGYFNPVYHTLTDPIGRRTGFVNDTTYREIPNAYYSPRGDIETLVVVNPLPGTYKLTVYGIDGKKGLASFAVFDRPTITVRTTGGDASVQEQWMQVPERPRSRGDVNGDGTINQKDLDLLKTIFPYGVLGNGGTLDMNGDDELNQADVDILTAYLNVVPTKAPSLSPNRAPVVVAVPTPRAGDPPVSPIQSPILGSMPTSPFATISCHTTTTTATIDKCNNNNHGFTIHRYRLSRCIERCITTTSNRWLQWWWMWHGSAWKCGKCET